MSENTAVLHMWCSICGSELPNPEFASNYPNLVCDDCDSRARSASGASANRLMARPYDNPVYVDGCRCWRRYRFGGHITLRDAFSCDTLSEFYDRHMGESAPLQIFTGQHPPSVQEYAERFELQRVDHDADFTARTWGIILDGEVFATSSAAEEAFGSLEESVIQDVDNYPVENPLEDPWFMLEHYRSFGNQAQRPRVLYYHPLLDRPLTGGDQPFLAVVQTLESQHPAGPIHLLEDVPTERVSELNGDASVLSLGYNVAPRSELGPLKKRLIGGVVDVFDELAAVQNRMLPDLTDRYDGVKVSITRRQREIWSGVVDAETLLDIDWTKVESDTIQQVISTTQSKLSD